MKKTMWLSLLTMILFCSGGGSTAFGEDSEKEIKAFLNDFYSLRSDFLVNKVTELSNYYDQTGRFSRQAYRVEQNRKNYLQTWGEYRGIQFVNAQSQIRTTRIKVHGDTAQVSLAHSQKISYIYMDKILPVQSFGIGTWHVLTLKKSDDKWIVLKEWYLDPLEENPQLIPGTSGGTVNFPIHDKHRLENGVKYKRKRAVAYANKYAGMAWGAGNHQKYNSKYANYNNKGGDCTNFASQVIGDPEEGGGLKMRGSWRYIYNAGGTKTWVQTDAFKNFILYSGYGKVIASGHFTDLVKRTKEHPDTPFAKLMPGDLIAHVFHNDVDHFSIVTGFDDNGYPLVNSHSADRYMVPFDLGWDKHTKYMLIHIND